MTIPRVETPPILCFLPIPPPVKLRLLLSLLCLLSAAGTSRALLGDTLEAIIKHRGKKPDSQPDKSKAIWLFEGNDGQLAYAVRFDVNGKSVAETLKPAQLGHTLHPEFVKDFMKAQAGHLKDSPTLLEPKAGEKYKFAGKELTVAENEYVLVDAPNGVLLVWVRGSMPSVTAITPTALQ